MQRRNWKDGLDLDSVAAVIYLPDYRYLLQHREDREGVSYPDWWCLFGGACERGEDSATALHRELMEELEFAVSDYSPLLTCTFELYFEGRRTRKAFFSIMISDDEAQGLSLHEGQGLGWFQFDDVLRLGNRIVPYDLGIIALHHGRRNVSADVAD